jgi:hypothetical protein
MVTKKLSFKRCFILEDPCSRFSNLFQAVATIACEDILRSMVLMLGISRLRTMAKDTSGFCYIVVRKMFFRFISYFIVLRLRGSFLKHLFP